MASAELARGGGSGRSLFIAAMQRAAKAMRAGKLGTRACRGRKRLWRRAFSSSPQDSRPTSSGKIDKGAGATDQGASATGQGAGVPAPASSEDGPLLPWLFEGSFAWDMVKDTSFGRSLQKEPLWNKSASELQQEVESKLDAGIGPKVVDKIAGNSAFKYIMHELSSERSEELARKGHENQVLGLESELRELEWKTEDLLPDLEAERKKKYRRLIQMADTVQPLRKALAQHQRDEKVFTDRKGELDPVGQEVGYGRGPKGDKKEGKGVENPKKKSEQKRYEEANARARADHEKREKLRLDALAGYPPPPPPGLVDPKLDWLQELKGEDHYEKLRSTHNLNPEEKERMAVYNDMLDKMYASYPLEQKRRELVRKLEKAKLRYAAVVQELEFHRNEAEDLYYKEYYTEKARIDRMNELEALKREEYQMNTDNEEMHSFVRPEDDKDTTKSIFISYLRENERKRRQFKMHYGEFRPVKRYRHPQHEPVYKASEGLPIDLSPEQRLVAHVLPNLYYKLFGRVQKNRADFYEEQFEMLTPENTRLPEGVTHEFLNLWLWERFVRSREGLLDNTVFSDRLKSIQFPTTPQLPDDLKLMQEALQREADTAEELPWSGQNQKFWREMGIKHKSLGNLDEGKDEKQNGERRTVGRFVKNKIMAPFNFAGRVVKFVKSHYERKAKQQRELNEPYQKAYSELVANIEKVQDPELKRQFEVKLENDFLAMLEEKQEELDAVDGGKGYEADQRRRDVEAIQFRNMIRDEPEVLAEFVKDETRRMKDIDDQTREVVLERMGLIDGKRKREQQASEDAAIDLEDPWLRERVREVERGELKIDAPLTKDGDHSSISKIVKEANEREEFKKRYGTIRVPRSSKLVKMAEMNELYLEGYDVIQDEKNEAGEADNAQGDQAPSAKSQEEHQERLVLEKKREMQEQMMDRREAVQVLAFESEDPDQTISPEELEEKFWSMIKANEGKGGSTYIKNRIYRAYERLRYDNEFPDEKVDVAVRRGAKRAAGEDPGDEDLEEDMDGDGVDGMKSGDDVVATPSGGDSIAGEPFPSDTDQDRYGDPENAIMWRRLVRWRAKQLEETVSEDEIGLQKLIDIYKNQKFADSLAENVETNAKLLGTEAFYQRELKRLREETDNPNLELTDELKDFIDFQSMVKDQFPEPKLPEKEVDEIESQMYEHDLSYREEVIDALNHEDARIVYDVDDDIVELDQDDIPEPEGVDIEEEEEEEAQEADGDQPIALFVPFLLFKGMDQPSSVEAVQVCLESDFSGEFSAAGLDIVTQGTMQGTMLTHSLEVLASIAF